MVIGQPFLPGAKCGSGLIRTVVSRAGRLTRRDRRRLVVQAYILIQTEVGRARDVAAEIQKISGVVRVDAVTGPYDVVVLAEAHNVDELGKMIVSRVQLVTGITRTLTCSVVHL
jgi:DNA-binding Lrp family transcriptional regulator